MEYRVRFRVTGVIDVPPDLEGIAAMAPEAQRHLAIVSGWFSDIDAIERHIDTMVAHHLADSTTTPILHTIYETVRDSRDRAETFRANNRDLANSPTIQAGQTKRVRFPLPIERIEHGKMSHVIRNCLVACNLAAVSYSMLHTSAIALEDEELAEFAAAGLRTYAGLTSEIGARLPDVVVHDLEDSETGTAIDANAAAIAASQQPELWVSMPVDDHDPRKPDSSAGSE